MKLQEIISKSKETPFNELIKVTSYIPLLLKGQIVKNIIALSTVPDQDTGLMKKDFLFQELFTTIFITLELSDVEIENILDESGTIEIDVAIEAYEQLIESGIYNYICNCLINNDINALVDMEVKQKVDLYNSVAAVLQRTITSLVTKIPSEEGVKELMSQLSTQLGDLNILNPKKSTKKIKDN